MNVENCMTMAEAINSLNTYERLFRVLAREHGVAIVKWGRTNLIDRNDVEKLRPHVEAWQNRPRISRMATASA